MHEKADFALGSFLAFIGSTGAAVQLWGDIGSLFVIGLNVLVAGGGIWLVALRIRLAQMEKSTADVRNVRLDREANERADERATHLDNEADARSGERNARLDREAGERSK